MKADPAVWMLAVVYAGNVAMICLTDDMEEIDRYANMVPTEDDPAWDLKLMTHERGVSSAAAEEFRQMARDGVPFVGRHAHMLGIATAELDGGLVQ